MNSTKRNEIYYGDNQKHKNTITLISYYAIQSQVSRHVILKGGFKKLFCSIGLFLLVTFAQAQLSVIIENGISTADPGNVLAGKVLITNVSSTNDVTARLYLQDIINTLSGELYQDLEKASNERTNVPWIKLTTSEILVPASTTLEVPFQVIVPNNSDLEGSYWGIIMVQGEPKLIIEADPDVETSYDVQIVSRHALNVIVDIGNGYGELSFDNPQLITEGASVFQVDVHNSGNKIIRPETYLELYGESGVLIGRVDGNTDRLRPNNPKRVNFDLSTLYLLDTEGEKNPVALSSGTYTTTLIADAGGTDIYGVRYSLDIGKP